MFVKVKISSKFKQVCQTPKYVTSCYKL